MLQANAQIVTAADYAIEPATWLVLAIGVATIWLLHRNGKLDSELIAAGPSRSVGLTALEYIAIFFALLFSVVLTSLIVAQLTTVFPDTYGFDADGKFEASTPLAFAMLAMISQVVSNLPVLVVWMLLMTRHLDPIAMFRRIGLTQRFDRDFGKTVLLASLASIGLVFATNALTVIVGLIFGHPPPPTVNHVILEQLKLVIQQSDVLTISILLISAVILAPLFEELLYRGVMQTAIGELIGGQKTSVNVRWLAVVITSMLFIASHIAVGSWHALPSLFVLSIVLGWLVERHGKLWPAIVVHMIFNATNIALTFAIVLGGEATVS